MGDHNNLREYGYPDNENMANSEYDRCSRRMNGTDPKIIQ